MISLLLLYSPMPCPFFAPREPADWSGSYPRLPLGEAWEGECRACQPGFVPQGALLFEVCNTGQGRTRCERFPRNASRDAVRFHVVADRGETLEIRYVFEKECWPAGHGVAEFSAVTRNVTLAEDHPLLASQIAAFATTWMKRRPRK